MSNTERVTVTLPSAMVREIDRLEKNRSKFLQDAARGELERRRRELLELSLQHPHPESENGTELGLEDWAESLPEEDVDELVKPDGGIEVRWIEGRGWIRVRS